MNVWSWCIWRDWCAPRPPSPQRDGTKAAAAAPDKMTGRSSHAPLGNAPQIRFHHHADHLAQGSARLPAKALCCFRSIAELFRFHAALQIAIAHYIAFIIETSVCESHAAYVANRTRLPSG